MKGTEKGIALKIPSGEGEMHVHRRTLIAYLNSLPVDERGWIRFGVKPNTNPKRSVSHQLSPLTPDYRNRLTKVEGPQNYK